MPIRILRVVVSVLAAAVIGAQPAEAHRGSEAVFSSPQPPAADVPSVAATGTVQDLVIDNRVTGVTTRYLALRLDDGSSVALRGPGLDELPNGQRIEAVGRVSGETLFVTSTRAVPSGQDANATSTDTRPSTSVQGVLAVLHADYFAEGRGEYKIVVRSDKGGTTVLKLSVVPDNLEIGMLVIVGGRIATDGASLEASTITVVASPTPDDVALTPVTNQVLVILIKFTDSSAEQFSPVAVQQVMVSNSTSVANYYNEVSYGQQLLNITVTGSWLQAGVATPAGCDYTAIASLADAAASSAGYAVGNYKNRFYVMPYAPSCGWAGLGYIGFPYQAWSNGYNQLSVYGHELGHNFSLFHAGSLTCSGQVIGGSCGVAEYGDPFDVMGNINPMHFNAMQKSVLNWIPATSIKTHTSGTATYTLSPIESPGQSTYAVKIPAASNRTYWLEYRQPIGFDSGMASYPNNGAQIRVAAPFQFPCTNCGGDDTQILDTTLGSPGNFGDAALLVGQTYVDSTYGFSVNVVSATAGALTLSVSSGGGVTTTSTGVTSSANPSAVGASVTFTATVNGNGPTGAVNFTESGSSIAGCSAVAFTGGIANARTATCTSSNLTAGTHNIVAIYGGDAGNSASTSPTLSQGVTMTGTATTIGTSLSPAAPGALVTFTASVTGNAPTGSVNFTDGGATIAGCGGTVLSGAGNTRTATCSSSSLSAGTHSVVASYGGDGGNAASSSPALSEVISASGSINVALASAGAVASASSVYGPGYAAASVNDNSRTGVFGNGGAWAAASGPPGWVQINFNGGQTIDRVVVYSLQDNYASPVEPTDTMTFSLWGIVDFTVQGWNGSSWITLGTVTGNNLVKRTVSFSPFTTNQIRVNVTKVPNGVPIITEIEAWGS